MGSPQRKEGVGGSEHIGRLLLHAYRTFNRQAANQFRLAGHADVTVAHLSLLPHIERSGSRLVDLAARASMTKQAIGQLVSDLEKLGYLQRTVDTGDRRAYRISFTPQGLELLEDGLRITSSLDLALRDAIGADHYESLVEALRTIAKWPET